MIEDKDKRTRAILWMLQDVDPSMPLGQALGYLQAVEAELARQERMETIWPTVGYSPGPITTTTSSDIHLHPTIRLRYEKK